MDDYTTWQVMQEYLPRELLTEYRKAFNLFDRKDTGIIRLKDISEILRNMGWIVSLTEIEKILLDIVGSEFENFGADFADFEEYIAIVSVVATNCIPEDEMYRVFQHFDRDGDGFISSKELRELLFRIEDEVDEEDIQEMIQAADCDGDGKVSYEEFVRVMTNSTESSNVDQSSAQSSTDSNFPFEDETASFFSDTTSSISHLSLGKDVEFRHPTDDTREQLFLKENVAPRRCLNLFRQFKTLCFNKKRKRNENLC